MKLRQEKNPKSVRFIKLGNVEMEVVKNGFSGYNFNNRNNTQKTNSVESRIYGADLISRETYQIEEI